MDIDRFKRGMTALIERRMLDVWCNEGQVYIGVDPAAPGGDVAVFTMANGSTVHARWPGSAVGKTQTRLRGSTITHIHFDDAPFSTLRELPRLMRRSGRDGPKSYTPLVLPSRSPLHAAVMAWTVKP